MTESGPASPDPVSEGRAGRRPTEAETLLAVGQAVGSTLELTEVVRRTTRALVRALGADAGGAWGLDAAGDLLVPLAGYRVPKELAADLMATTLAARHPLMEAAKRLAGPVYATDSPGDPRFDHPLLGRLPHRSALIQPMWRKGEIIGAFTIVWLRDAHVFTPEELQLADGIARQAAVALENARLYETAERRRREAEAVAGIARTITASLDVDTVLQRVAEAARELCGSDMARIALWDAGAGAVVMRYRVGVRPEEDTRLRVEPGKGIGGLVLVAARPFRTDDYAADPRISQDYRDIAREIGVVAEMVVPIRIGDDVQGLLYIDNRSPRPFGDWDEAVLLRLAEHAGVAIQNGRLYAEAERRRGAAESLADVGRLVSQSLDPEEVQQRIVDSVRRLLGTAHAALFRLDPAPDGGRVLAVSGGPTSATGAGDVAAGAVMRLATREERPVATADFLADPRLAPAGEAPAGGEAETDRAVLAVPLLVGSRVVGALAVRDRVGRIFDREEERLLQAFADQAAMALENARLYAETARLLGDYQRRLEELSVLYELSRALTGQLDVDRLVGTLQREVSRVFDARNILIVLYDQRTSELEVALEMVDGVVGTRGRRVPLGVGLAGRVIERREAIRTADYAAACRTAGVEPVSTALAFRHWLGVPMIAGDEVIGLVALRSATRAFTEADARLLSNIAGLTALTVRSARLHADTTRAYEELARAQEQLAQARKMEAIGRLAGGIAHDFNNLLTVVKGRSQLLLERLRSDDPVRRQIALIEEMAERAAGLTRQLLAFSRKQVLEPRVLDVNLVVEGLERMLRRLIGEDIELIVRLDPGLGPVRADPSQLEQVIVNLAANARDAMPVGGTLTIETANVQLDGAAGVPPADAQPGAYARLSVRDTGVGMDAGTQARLFEPFFTTKELGKGTGLGLATVYGIVKQSGGSIAVRSVADAGTTFDVYLPRVMEAVELPPVSRRPEEGRGGTETVLLVEDEEPVRQLAREVLETRGYQVLEAPDGGQALQVAEQHAGPIALLLTDVVMPGITGPELARRLGARRPELKVLFVSGYAERGAGGPGPSASPFLQKPFTPDLLAGKVREVLDRTP